MSIVASDTFAGTNGQTLATYSASWESNGASGCMEILSASVRPAQLTSTNGYHWIGDPFLSDQFSQVTLMANGTTGPTIGPAVRMVLSVSKTFYGYAVNGNSQELWKYVESVGTSLGSTSVSLSNGDIIRLDAVGNEIIPTINGATTGIGAISDVAIVSGAAGLMQEDSASTVLVDDWQAGNIILAFDEIAPDAIAASTNLTGSVSAIQDDPAAPDGTWLTATSATAVTDLRVTFPTPSDAIYGTQAFLAWVRKTTGTPNPTVTVELRQSNVLMRVLVSVATVSSTTGQLISAPWNATDMDAPDDGSDIECRIVSVPGTDTGTPGAMPAYAATGTMLSTFSAAGTNNVNIPTHSAGSLLLLHVSPKNTEADGALSSINTEGWSQAAGNTYGGAIRCHIAVAWKIGNGSETTVNITTTGGASADALRAIVHVFTAANGFADPPVANIGTTSGESAALNMPTVVPSGNNQLAIALLVTSENEDLLSATGETGGNWTQILDLTSSATISIGIHSSAQTTGTTISGGTTDAGGSTANWVGVGFTLIPATVGGSGVNTVEIGAVQWSASGSIFESAGYTVASDGFA